MAEAPRPGATRRADEKQAAKQVLEITICGETYTLAPALIPFSERQICRKATGFPIGHYMSDTGFDVDSVMVLWWMARRAHGEAFLTLKRVEEEWQRNGWPESWKEGDVKVVEDDGVPDPAELSDEELEAVASDPEG